jgi:cation transport protein ChaC
MTTHDVSPANHAPTAQSTASQRLSRDQLEASLRASLAHWNGRAPLWVFGYGSLIWKPELDFELRLPARVHGYHRRLCLRSVMYRGTAESPGVVAGLDRGGSCAGVLFRVPAAAVRAQFPALWERELLLGSYAPRWLSARRLDRGTLVRALAFVVRRDAVNYCGQIDERQLLSMVANARGHRGSSLEYLQHTVAALREVGLRDPHLERLLQTVAK